MNTKDFDNLVQGVKEMKSILTGKSKPSYRRAAAPLPVKNVRSTLKLTQTEFARLLAVPVTTLKNWESGRTRPRGSARALLVIAQKHPQTVLEALNG